MLKCTIQAIQADTLLLSFPKDVSNEQIASIDEAKQQELCKVVQMLGYKFLKYELQPIAPIPQADTVQEVQKIIPHIQETAHNTRGGEVKSIGSFVPKKETYQKTPEDEAFLEKYEFLIKNERIEDAKALSQEYMKNK